MVNKMTDAELVVYPLQFIEEGTEGNAPGSGSYAAIGLNTVLSVKKGGQWVEVPQLGSEDIAGLVQGAQKFPFQIKYSPINSTFLKYGVNSANYTTPTGTVSKSLTILLSIWYNGVINYIVFTGCRISKTQISAEVGKPIMITMDVVCMFIAQPTSVVPAGTLVTSVPAGAAWSWVTGGANPLTYNSFGQDVKKWSVTIDRNTKEEWTMGNVYPFGSLAHGRRISWSIDALWDATSTFEADFTNGVSQTITIVLKTALSTLTLSNSQATDYDRDFDIGSNAAIVETVPGKSTTCAVT